MFYTSPRYTQVLAPLLLPRYFLLPPEIEYPSLDLFSRYRDPTASLRLAVHR